MRSLSFTVRATTAVAAISVPAPAAVADRHGATLGTTPSTPAPGARRRSTAAE
ncbi:hypothetical protein [Streptomyces sp. AM 2-1-1]|uniref:hypothetical protein n=1 Tax=Streptomyces sp. AM 2-1-1 TaxID=3028709 RepID=UPI0023B93182|nr:hypothetical protein [Streptomyces sp. AM 2-1-1]WEH41664.1 hypothetical protein PZB77_20395 [Streptomyces sp. AM 2-1-1]